MEEKLYDTSEQKERIIVVGVATSENDDTDKSLDELIELGQTAGVETVAKVIQNREKVHPGTYIGKGKIEEVRELVIKHKADTVVCDDELTPAQFNNLSQMLDVKVVDRTVMILDNSTTGMTGHQDHAATGKTLQGDPTYAIDIPALCRAIGVKNVVEVNARDIQAVEKAVKEEIAKDEVSVIITKTPCVLLDKSKKPLYQTHTDKCKKCGMCMKPGCPAMTKNADGTVSIDDTMCTGCGLCASLCKFDAIELVKEGDR